MPGFAPPFRHSLILAEDRVTPSFLVSGCSQSRTRRPAVAAVTRIVTAGRWTRVPEPTFGDAPSCAFIHVALPFDSVLFLGFTVTPIGVDVKVLAGRRDRCMPQVLHALRHPVPARQETIDRAGRKDFAILVDILPEVPPHRVAGSSLTRNGTCLPAYTCGIGLASSTEDSKFDRTIAKCGRQGALLRQGAG